MWMKIWWIDKWPCSDIRWRLVVRRMIVVWILRMGFLIDGAIWDNVLLIELYATSLISSIFVSIFVFIISSCYFVGVSNLVMLVMLSLSRSFHKLIIWTEFLWYGVTRAIPVFLWCSFFKAVFILWDFGWYLCELFFMLVYLGTCIGNFCKHSIDVFIQGFHIILMFVGHGSHGFDVIVNFVEVIFW